LINSERVLKQNREILSVLLDYCGYILQLGKFVAVVVCKHTLRTHQLVAGATEILNLFFLVLEAEYFIHVGHF
jgi:hypothetical protein